MVFVAKNVFQSDYHARQFASLTFLDFFVDFCGPHQRLVFVDVQECIQVCLLPDFRKMKQNPVDA